MKVSIFGGTGFVGEYIINELINANYKPYALIRLGNSGKISTKEKIKIITGDLSNPTAIEQTIMNTEVVIYNVGIIREFKSYDISFENLHFESLQKVVDIAKKLNVKRFILMSANGVKEEGTSYQNTKYKAEQYLKESGLDWTIFRPSLIFGESNGKQEFCEQLKKDMLSLPFPAPLFFKGISLFKAGLFKMSPIHVKDVASIFVKSLSIKECIGKVYDLGGENKTWKDIINEISIASGKSKLCIPAPVFPIKFLASIFDRFSWFPISRDQLTMLLEGNTCESEEVFKFFDISPIPFKKENLKYLNDEKVK